MKKPELDPLDPEAFALENQEIEPASMEIMYQLIDQQVRLESDVAQLETQLKEKKAALREVSEMRIPAIAEQLKLKKFESPDGLQIMIKEDVKASISNNPEAKAAAIKYLRDTGNGALVKEQLLVNVADVDTVEVLAVKEFLQSHHVGFNEKLDVNTSSLKAFVRRELEAGNKDFDPKTFGVFQYRKTVIK